jgi:PPK2 family polyphosphate:nucleotide phosphotransferase
MPSISRKDLERLVAPFRVTSGRGFHLKDYKPGATLGLKNKEQAGEWLRRGVEALADLQERLYAQDRWALLLVFQAMDAAGKDGTIKHVMSGVTPQGCQVYSFKAPSTEELDHDFLWRTSRSLPERGRIGIFNRSYYEETLVVRVHPELLAKQHLPQSLVSKRIWKDRFEDINNFEHYLARNGIIVLKFFLNVGKEEQRQRFLARLEMPEKNWKFSLADAQERQHWSDYQEAYDDMIKHTATSHAPWHIVPANNKWFARLVVAATVVQRLQELKLQFPDVDPGKRRELAAARAALEQEANGGKGTKKRSRRARSEEA